MENIRALKLTSLFTNGTGIVSTKLKSNYLSKRTESLQYRLQQIADSTTGQAQTEKETIRLQLQEIEAFAKKIDELIAEGYDPKLDEGVGKNIAPIQAKGMLKAEVLKTTGESPN
ncbi:MAG: hypothetical protein IPK10_19895 [Bacteroidetes bacterium]|nr:hypothetical protein [Bacteroidota bacterium]